MIIVNRNQVLERWNELPNIFKEAIYSPQLNDQIYKVSEQFHLSERKQQNVSYLCLLVFTGFIHRQDLYKELQSTLGIDNRLALEIYGELDKKIFFPFHKEIDKNYLKFSLGIEKNIESNDGETKNIKEQVVLKKNEPDTINLREGVTEAPKTIGQSAPHLVPIGADAEKVDKPIEKESDINTKEINLKETKEPAKPLPKHAKMVSPAKGPVILHKREEFKTVSQESPSEGYKVASFGGFGGSFNTPFSKNEKSEASEAEIEIPSNKNMEKDAYSGSVAVPVSLENNDTKKPKSIHYSSLKTDISDSVPIDKDEDDDEIVDISTMKLKKK